MKFIRKEFIVTTIFDKELTEKDEILIVLKNLLNEGIDFSITIRKHTHQQQDYFNMSFEKVRVKRIYDDDTVDLLSFKKGAKTSIKKISIDDLISIEATTKKYKILDVDSSIDRFDILDL
jgi:hypothetical protein